MTDIFKVSPQTLKILGATINLLFNLTSVSGGVGAYVDLLKLLVGGKAGQPDTLSQVHQMVSELHDLVKATARNDVVNKVIQEWKSILEGQEALRLFLLDAHPGAPAFITLNQSYLRLVGATQTLLGAEFQTFTKEASDYRHFPWYNDRSWLVGRQAANQPPSANINKMEQSDVFWDYLPYIGAITGSVSLLMLYFKTLDPAFRTTGTFQPIITQIADLLETFGQTMAKHIVWTRDWTMQDYYFRPMAYGWPVGAVDVCSGVSIFDPAWMEGVAVAPPTAIGNSPDPAGVVFRDPPIVLNMAESLNKARLAREKAWLLTFFASGAPKILQLAETLREMATVPESSETVVTTVRKSARRKFVGTEPRQTPQIPRCDALEFTASVYAVKRSVRVNGALQAPKRHPEEPFYYQIPYQFFIETYTGGGPLGQPLSRVELNPGDQSIPLQAQVFDWEVEDDKVQVEISPIIQERFNHLVRDKYVVLANSRPDLQVTQHPWDMPLNRHAELLDEIISDPDLPGTARNGTIRPITLAVQFTRNGSEFKAFFRNASGKENIAGVYFAIEEHSRLTDQSGDKRPGPIIKTRIDVSMIARELHLPKKYFDYIRMCEARTRAIISQIEFEYRLKEKPIPRWDPVIQENVSGWVQQVLLAHPYVLEGDLLQEAQSLARSYSLIA